MQSQPDNSEHHRLFRLLQSLDEDVNSDELGSTDTMNTETSLHVRALGRDVPALQVSTPDVVQSTLHLAGADLKGTTLRVDLQAVIHDMNAEYRPVRPWARNRQAEDPDGARIIRLTPETIRELAAALGCPRSALVRYLATFTPVAAPWTR